MDPIVAALSQLGLGGLFIAYLVWKSKRDAETIETKDKQILELQEKRIEAYKDVILVVQNSLKESADGSESIVEAMKGLKEVISSLEKSWDPKAIKLVEEGMVDLMAAMKRLERKAV